MIEHPDNPSDDPDDDPGDPSDALSSDVSDKLLSLGDTLLPAQLSQEQRDRMRRQMIDRARTSGPEGTKTRRAADSPWIAIAPMVEVRQLYRDASSGTHLSLIRMRPGGTIPPHVHAKEETFIILEGACHIGHYHLSNGDVHIAAAGSWHDSVTTQSGVLVLLKGEYPYPGTAPAPAATRSTHA